ncbi:MAG: ABC transporter permease [Clostridia bacterium]|nr:ABC transporter permease [Clostridia bacterium]
MKILDLIKLSVLNLYRRKSRTALTVVGVVIGTACIVIMISLGLTNLVQFNKMLENSDLEKIEVFADENNGMNKVKLNDAAVNAFLNVENVEYVIPQKRITFYGEFREYYASYFSAIAVPSEYLYKFAEVEEGQLINPDSSMMQIVMGEGAFSYFVKNDDEYTRNYTGPNVEFLAASIDLYLGGIRAIENEEIPISKLYKAQVTGILKNEEEEYKTSDVYMSLDMAQKVLSENYKTANALNMDINGYDTIYVYADNMDNVQEILNTIRSYGFEAYSNTEWITELKAQQKAQQGQLLAIGLIALVVSAIGIANTMMTSIIERKKEIGVMKVIGVSILKIRALFLIESAIIGAVGGIAGCMLAHVFGYVVVSYGDAVNFLGMYFQSGMKFIMPLWLDLSAIGIAVFVGVTAGFFPARSATMLSALEAVRG